MSYDLKSLTRTVRTKARISETHEFDGEPCWEWTGACDSSGYAQVKMHGRLVLVHRYTYEKLVGPIELEGDDDPTIDHRCKGLRRCINPSHMEIVSRSENSRRANHRRHVEGYSRTRENVECPTCGGEGRLVNLDRFGPDYRPCPHCTPENVDSLTDT